MPPSALLCTVLKQVKKIIVYTLILGICLPDGALHTVTSTTALVAHYFHHITDHEYIGVRDFLILHSADNAHMQEDMQEHKHLPGSDNKQNCQHAQVVPAVAGNTEVSLILPELLKTKHRSFVQQYLPKRKSAAIWQPPKLA